jgi:zinc/manganese transport system substrate-binding protein
VIIRRRILLAALAFALSAGSAVAQSRIKVVASFSILGDLVRQVGGERIDVVTLVGPNGDTHAFSPTPSDARLVSAARVVFVNGLGLEGWMTRLVKSSGSKAPLTVASAGIKIQALANEGRGGRPVTDPHAWQSVANVKIYVANIRDGLITADPSGRSVYEANAAAYLARLDALESEVKAKIGAIPLDRRKIITTHDAFGYFAKAYGVSFVAPTGVSTDAEPSASDVARIITQIREQKIPAVFMENITDPRIMQQIAKESGARIGGTLYSDALSPPGGPAATYLDLMQSNLSELTKVLLN